MFSFNSAILAKHISELNNDVFVKPFGIYGAININAVNFQAQLNQAKKKVANGVTVLFTQPVLSEEAFHNLIQIKKELDVKVMGGIIPIVSHRNANFMNNEIAGINVSEDIIRQYEGIDKEEATKLAIKLSVEIAKKITDYVDGYYIITPFRRVDIVEQIIKEIREF
jgi:homocysteine S-methyltransferase